MKSMEPTKHGWRSKHVRVVPLVKKPDDIRAIIAAHAKKPPQLTYRGGQLIQNVHVYTVFWGLPWGANPLQQIVSTVNQFFTFVLTSALIDQLAEYNTNGMTIGHGSLAGTKTITAGPPAAGVSDADIQTFLRDQIASKTLPTPTADMLYFVYLPPNVAVTQGNEQSCQNFCGYHDQTADQILYAVMPYPGCSGCVGDFSDIDALTSTSSHELCEAITDPDPGQGWYDDTYGEIGDICAWQTKQLGNYLVQLEWSNSNGKCV